MNVNIYHKHIDIIITTFILPLGHISNSLPLALESTNLDYMVIYTNGGLVLVMFCPWEMFSQRIRHIQICVYFANIYVTILDTLLGKWSSVAHLKGPSVAHL